MRNGTLKAIVKKLNSLEYEFDSDLKIAEFWQILERKYSEPEMELVEEAWQLSHDTRNFEVKYIH